MDKNCVVDHKLKVKIEPPKSYRVILLNDNYTTMDFVIEVLMRFFNHNYENAYQIMMSIHLKGRGTCGIYLFEIAEMKVLEVSQFAKENQFPLRCIMERVE